MRDGNLIDRVYLSSWVRPLILRKWNNGFKLYQRIMNFKSDQVDGINPAFAAARARDPRLDCKLDYLSLSRSAPPPQHPREPFFLPGSPCLVTVSLPLFISFFPGRHVSASPATAELNGSVARNKGAADAAHLHNKSGNGRDMKS